MALYDLILNSKKEPTIELSNIHLSSTNKIVLQQLL